MESIIEEYKSNIDRFKDLKSKGYNLIHDLCKKSDVDIHHLTCRLKTEESLQNKIATKGEKYNSINDITDIIGFRIITLYENDVEKIANIIKKEFLIDIINSQDKSEILSSNQFGYKSIHFISSIGKSRKGLPEFNDISNIRFEIQIRSILQHSWAEIEHKLGYKSEIGVPDEIKRDFSRIAGLLELADLEFIRIRENLNNYSNKITINDSSEPISVDLVTAKKFLSESNMLNKIEKEISKLSSCSINGEIAGTWIIKILSYLEISDLNSLEEILKLNQKTIINFTANWIKGQGRMSKGTCIWTLPYVLYGESNPDKLINYFLELKIGGQDIKAAEDNTQRISKVLKSIK
ncbi:MAG: hypothetical protein KAR57_07225 [Bacteroidales bacterium]|nr:hypothetical protein [Bacteroidales bacterium]